MFPFFCVGHCVLLTTHLTLILTIDKVVNNVSLDNFFKNSSEYTDLLLKQELNNGLSLFVHLVQVCQELSFWLRKELK